MCAAVGGNGNIKKKRIFFPFAYFFTNSALKCQSNAIKKLRRKKCFFSLPTFFTFLFFCYFPDCIILSDHVKFIIKPVFRFLGVLNNFCFIKFSLKSMDGALGVLWALLFDPENQGEGAQVLPDLDCRPKHMICPH